MRHKYRKYSEIKIWKKQLKVTIVPRKQEQKSGMRQRGRAVYPKTEIKRRKNTTNDPIYQVNYSSRRHPKVAEWYHLSIHLRSHPDKMMMLP